MSADISSVGRRYLQQSENTSTSEPLWAIASALQGLLAVVVELGEKDERNDYLEEQWTKADSALGRVLEVADQLASHPGATLKPTAFGDLAQRIRDAVHGEDSAVAR